MMVQPLKLSSSLLSAIIGLEGIHTLFELLGNHKRVGLGLQGPRTSSEDHDTEIH